MDNELIYPDTNFYIDYFENRVDRLRPLGEFAYNLLRKSMLCEYKIILSSLVIDELEFNGYGEKIKDLIKSLKDLDKIIFIKESEDDDRKARKLKKERNTSLNDTKHAILAQKSKALFLVTRNMNDFTELQDLIQLKYPENL